MPHCTVEYTDNIANHLNINVFLQAINDSLLAHDGLFSAPGIRSRAIKLTDYKVGTGTGNDAFIHVRVEIAAGRTAETKQRIQDHLFTTLEKIVQQLETETQIALSLTLTELNHNGQLYRQT